MQPLTLHQRIRHYNESSFPPPPLVISKLAGRDFIHGTFFLGGSRHSDFYGAYHTEYLRRITSIFSDAEKVVHLFSGSLPAGRYTRIGIDPTGLGKTADVIGNAESLSSFLPFNPDVIFADPPYTQEEAEDKYQVSLVNGPRVVDECGIVLQPGGYLIWLDQRLPVFSNDRLNLVGLISYIRSTGNRFRCVCIFKKPANKT